MRFGTIVGGAFCAVIVEFRAHIYGVRLPMTRRDVEKEMPLVACHLSQHMNNRRCFILRYPPIFHDQGPSLAGSILPLRRLYEIEESYAAASARVRHSTYIANRHTCMAHESGVSGACSSQWEEQKLHACSQSILF